MSLEEGSGREARREKDRCHTAWPTSLPRAPCGAAEPTFEGPEPAASSPAGSRPCYSAPPRHVVLAAPISLRFRALRGPELWAAAETPDLGVFLLPSLRSLLLDPRYTHTQLAFRVAPPGHVRPSQGRLVRADGLHHPGRHRQLDIPAADPGRDGRSCAPSRRLVTTVSLYAQPLGHRPRFARVEIGSRFVAWSSLAQVASTCPSCCCSLARMHARDKLEGDGGRALSLASPFHGFSPSSG